MIENKLDLKDYLEQDRIALHLTKKHPNFFGDDIWKFQIALRKMEYAKNTKKIFRYIVYRHKYHKLSYKLNFSIPLNVFDKGLSIAHMGTIVVNSHAKIGKNCRIQEMVNIGSTNGSNDSAKIGNNVFIGTGAKIIGGVTIADNVVIGANAVVVKDILEPGTTWGGVPARKISEHDSKPFIDKRLFDMQNSEENDNENKS